MKTTDATLCYDCCATFMNIKEGAPVDEASLRFRRSRGQAATVVIAVTALITGLVRLVLRERSPWKVRSVVFDAFIGIALGIGLLVLLILFPVGM